MVYLNGLLYIAYSEDSLQLHDPATFRESCDIMTNKWNKSRAQFQLLQGLNALCEGLVTPNLSRTHFLNPFSITKGPELRGPLRREIERAHTSP